MTGEARFDGRVAVVTGAAGGLGRAYAQQLASRGARVVASDLRGAEETVEIILSEGGEAVAHAGDVASEADTRALVDLAVERFGRLDIVINNAGIDQTTPFAELTVAEFDLNLRVHLLGAFLVVRAAWPHMVRQRFGRIVSTSSGAALGSAPGAAYGAAKFGVVGLMKCLAMEGQPYGITANAIMPYASTSMNEEYGQEADTLEEAGTVSETLRVFSRLFTSLPSGPELVAPVVGWLCHEDTDVSGEILHAGFGAVGRVVVAQGPVAAPEEVTIESVRDRWTAISREKPLTLLPDVPSAGRSLERALGR
ncbi:MAG TPA: SDR family NAD(P)-dependent oxidoreductase [Amycolatopsis sp.]|nr:SDR family NAD(P)-dependent oxidoreductase [Amycolatopsis sp.]